MMPTTNSDARINFRLSLELKKTIEDAAAEMGSPSAISPFPTSFMRPERFSTSSRSPGSASGTGKFLRPCWTTNPASRTRPW